MKMRQEVNRREYWIPDWGKSVPVLSSQEIDEDGKLGTMLKKYYAEDCILDGDTQSGAEKLSGLKSSASEIDGSVNRDTTILPKSLISRGEDIIPFNDISNWNISTGDESKFTVVNESFFDGDSYVHYQETDVGTNASFTVVEDIDLRNSDFISIYVWSDTFSSFGNTTLQFSTSETSYTNNFEINIKTLMKTKPNEWNNIRIPIDELTANGTINRKDLMKSFRFIIFGTGGELNNIKFGGLKLNVKSRPAITFSFDDGNETDFTQAYPILKEYGFTGISYIITDEIGTTPGNPPLPRLSLTQLNELVDNGWYIGVHGTNFLNWVTDQPIGDAELSIKGGRDYIFDNNLNNLGTQHAAYPHGEYNDDVINLLKKYGIKYARTTNEFPQQSPVEDLHTINLGFALKPTLQENIDELESLMSKGGLINLYAHEMYEDRPEKITPSVFRAFVGYVNDNYKKYVTDLPTWAKQYETGTIV